MTGVQTCALPILFGNRFGKSKELGVFKSKQEAKRSLEKFLIKTLGASGYIEKGGKKLKAEETGLLKELGFRKSKLNKFLIVEKKNRRLKKGTSEVPEIQFFKKKGRKKSKSLFGI